MTLAEILVKIGVDPKDLEKGLGGASRAVDQWAGNVTRAGTTASLALTAPILAIGGASLKMAMDAVESENLFRESFKGMADQAYAWSQTTATALGLNQYELRRTSSTFYVMFDAMALGKTASYEMATGLSQLAYDFASFYNLKPEEAFVKLRAGIMGEAEPLKALGILVDENTVKHYAYKTGIAATGAELTQQQKVMARYAAIMAQTSTAQGDLARTADSPTNQLRRLKEQASEAAVTFGMALIPTFKDVLGMFSSGVTYVKAFADWFAQLPQPVRTTSIVIAGLVAAIGPALVVIGSMASGVSALLPLFASGGTAAGIFGGALAVLTGPVGLVVGALAALAGGVRYMAGSWDPVTIVMKAAWNVLKSVGEAAFDLGRATIQVMRAGLEPFGTAIGWIVRQVRDAIGAITGWFPSLDGIKSRLAGIAGGAWDYVKSLAGVNSGQATTTASAKTTTTAADILGKQYKTTGDLASFLAGESRNLAGGTDAAGKAAKKAADDYRQLVATMSGQEAFTEAKNLVRAITEIGGATKLTTEEQKRALDVLTDAIAKYQAMGQTAPPAMLALAMRLQENAAAARDAATGVAILAENLDRARPSAQGLGADLNTMTATMRGLGAHRDAVLPGFAPTVLTEFQRQAQAAGRGAGVSLTAGMGDYLRNGMGTTIIQALQGGGNPMQAVGANLGQMLGQNLATRAGSWLGSALGPTIGGALGSVIPGLGTIAGSMLGQYAGRALSRLGGLFGLGGNNERRQVEQAIQGVMQQMPNLREAAAAAGISLDRLFNARRMSDFNRELSTVQAGLQAFQAQQQQMERNRATAGDLFGQIMELGANGVPDAMRGTLDSFVQLGLLTQDQIAQLNGLGSAGAVNLKKMEDALGVIGGRVESLGPKFAQTKINEEAMKVANAITTILDGGGDWGSTLMDARDELAELAKESKRTGVTLPANLKPWMEDLVKSGNFIDKNGEKITDLSGINWGAEQKTEAQVAQEGWAAITQMIQELIDQIRGPLNDAMDHATRDRTIDIDINDPGNYDRGGQHTNPGERGERGNFSSGTMGQYGSWFKNFGGGFNARLHGNEAVIRHDQAVPFALDTLATTMPGMMEGGSLAAGSTTSVRTSSDVYILGVQTQRAGESVDALIARVAERLPQAFANSGRARLGMKQVLGVA